MEKKRLVTAEVQVLLSTQRSQTTKISSAKEKPPVTRQTCWTNNVLMWGSAGMHSNMSVCWQKRLVTNYKYVYSDSNK